MLESGFCKEERASVSGCCFSLSFSCDGSREGGWGGGEGGEGEGEGPVVVGGDGDTTTNNVTLVEIAGPIHEKKELPWD